MPFVIGTLFRVNGRIFNGIMRAAAGRHTLGQAVASGQTNTRAAHLAPIH